MKKHFIIILSGLLISTASFAQEETSTDASAPAEEKVKKEKSTGGSSDLSFESKNGHEVLPQAGDCAIGIGANGLLSYVGNLPGTGSGTTSFTQYSYNNGGNNPFSGLNGINANSIFAKYFTSASTAYRAHIDFNFMNQTSNVEIDNDLSSLTDERVYDKATQSGTAIALAVGLEKRRGNSRVQGFYGAEFVIATTSGTNLSYEYGNEMTSGNQTPGSTATNAFGLANPNAAAPALGHRTLSQKTGSAFGVGARGFVGVEYFIAPKLSLGGEFSWGLMYSKTGKSSRTTEVYDALQAGPVTYTREVKSSSLLNAGIGNAGGSVNVFFYF